MKKLINLTMFDLLKGVAMLGVIFVHSVYLDNRAFGAVWYERIIHTLLMPTFFLTSGYWLKKKTIKAGIKNSAEYLLKPLLLVLVIINSIGLLHRLLIGNIEEWLDIFFLPSIIMTNKSASRLGPLWYILALFLAWSLFYLVIQIKEEKWQIIIAIMSALIGGILMPLRLPYQIAQGMVAFFFVYTGYYIKKKKLLERKIHWGIYISLIIAWGVIVFWGSMDFYSYNIKYGILSVIGSTCGSFLLIKLFLYVNLLEWSVLDGIRWIGRHSMWIMCIHAIEGAVFPWKILFHFVKHETMMGMLALFVLRTVLGIIICILIESFQRYMSKKMKCE